MKLIHLRAEQINGSLVTVDGAGEASFDEVATLCLPDGTKRTGRVVKIEGDSVTLQVFEGSRGINASDIQTVFEGAPLELALSPEILGRVFDGLGRPIDGLGEIYPDVVRDVNGAPINPVSREYPRNFIQTGISAIDALATLVRGQKLPIFSGYGMKHNELAAQIAKQPRFPTERISPLSLPLWASRTTWRNISANPLKTPIPTEKSSCS